MKTYGPVGHTVEQILGTPAERAARVRAFGRHIVQELKNPTPASKGEDMVIVHDIYQGTASVSTEYKGQPWTFGAQESHDDAETRVLEILESNPNATVKTNDYRKKVN